MATQSHSLSKLFSSGPESSYNSFDPSLPSPPDSNTSHSSSIVLSRVDSGSSAIVLQSKLNPESAVWTPTTWGELSPTTSKVKHHDCSSCCALRLHVKRAPKLLRRTLTCPRPPRASHLVTTLHTNSYPKPSRGAQSLRSERLRMALRPRATATSPAAAIRRSPATRSSPRRRPLACVSTLAVTAASPARCRPLAA